MTKRLSWAERIDRAEKRGRFTLKDADLAGEWRSCALGERMGFPTTGDYIDDFKVYHPLYRAGVKFADAVYDNDFAEARRLYQEIQTMPMETA